MNTEPTVDDMLALRAQGMNNRQIGDHFGRTRDWVSKQLVAAGHPLNPAKLPTARELAALLDAGETAPQIAARYNCRPDSVYEKISHARRRGELPKRGSASVREIDLPEEVDWDRVPCKQADPETFFPEGYLASERAEEARQVCGTCPGRMDCYAGALKRREPHGVWGGVLFAGGKPARGQYNPWVAA